MKKFLQFLQNIITYYMRLIAIKNILQFCQENYAINIIHTNI